MPGGWGNRAGSMVTAGSHRTAAVSAAAKGLKQAGRRRSGKLIQESGAMEPKASRRVNRETGRFRLTRGGNGWPRYGTASCSGCKVILSGWNRRMRQKSSPLLPFRGIKHCEAPHKRSDRQRSARQPECVTNGLKCGPMIVAPQNAIPVEDGMCFHGRLLFENFSSLRRTLCHPVTASHPVIECFSCPSYGRSGYTPLE